MNRILARCELARLPTLPPARRFPCCGSRRMGRRTCLADGPSRRRRSSLLEAPARAVWHTLYRTKTWQEAFDSHPRIRQSPRPGARNRRVGTAAGPLMSNAPLPSEDDAAQARAGRGKPPLRTRSSGASSSSGSRQEKPQPKCSTILEARMKNDRCSRASTAAEQQRQITELRLAPLAGVNLTHGHLHTISGHRARASRRQHVPYRAFARCTERRHGRSSTKQPPMPTAAAKIWCPQSQSLAARHVSHPLETSRHTTRRNQTAGPLPLRREIAFTVSDCASKHYHIPLLLAAHGYTTHRGS